MMSKPTIYMTDTQEDEDAVKALSRIDDNLIDSGEHCHETWANLASYAKYLQAEVKKKKNRIGILNRSLRRLKKDK